MTSNIAADAAAALKLFFRTYEPVTGINLLFPDGNYGKPYDNYYSIDYACISGDRLDAGLGWGLYFSLNPRYFSVSDDCFTLSITGSGIIVGGSSWSRRYDFGPVTFEVFSRSPNAVEARKEFGAELEALRQLGSYVRSTEDPT